MRHFWKSSQSLIEIEKFLLIFFWQKVFFFWSRFFHLDVINVGNLHKSDISRLFHLFLFPRMKSITTIAALWPQKEPKKFKEREAFEKKFRCWLISGFEPKRSLV